MTPRAAAPRPHGSVAARGLHRPIALGLLTLCICGSFLLVWRSFSERVPSGFATSLSGHSYHPKLCNNWSSPQGHGGASSGCGELHDPELAEEVVRVPPSLQLLSGDPQLAALQQLLQTAAQQQWPLPLARRVTSLLLQSAVPPVSSSSSSSSRGDSGDAATSQQRRAGSKPQLPLSAAESGHAAGWRFATQALAVLRQRGGAQLVPCSFDPSLPTDFHTRFLYAASWPATSSSSSSGGGAGSTAHANSVLQLLSAVALLPPGYAYVSIFVPAAAAADSLVWLDLLQLLAAPLGVPLQLVQQGSQAAAAAASAPDDTAAAGQPAGSRTAGQALNAALAAFFPTGAAAAPAAAGKAAPAPAASTAAAPGQQDQQQGRLNAWHRLQAQLQLGGDSATPADGSGQNATQGSVRHGSCPAGAPAPGCYEPEFVLLLEPQLFFCAGDLVRLMEYPEDLVCGLQLDEFKPVQLKHHRHLLHSHPPTPLPRRLQQQGPTAAGTAAAAAGGVVDGPMASAVAAAGAAVLKPEVPPEFEMHALRAAYDAAREVSGEILSAHAPYLSHGPSQALAQAGAPVPMYCCWGGVAKLKAGPLAAGLRFRGGEEGECHPPDHMSLMCDDLWRTGHTRVIMDPGVRTSSQLRTKGLFEDPRFPFFYYTENWETTAWFDIHSLLPLQYWNKTHVSNSSSSDSPDDSREPEMESKAGAPALWIPSDWEPGQQQMCCQGQRWSGAARFNHPTDCRRVELLGGKNYTAAFLQHCSAGSNHSQGNSSLGGNCW